MVIKQYNARGPLVDTLLPVVALDDAAFLTEAGRYGLAANRLYYALYEYLQS